MSRFVPDKQQPASASSGRFVPDQSAGGGGKKKKHRGFFGSVAHDLGKAVHNPVGHIATKTGEDLYNAAVKSPAGAYALARAYYNSGLKPPWMRKKGESNEFGNLIVAMGKQTARDFRHPLAHPGNTLLDAWAAASLGAGTAARIGAASKALSETGSAAEATRMLMRPPSPAPLKLRAGGMTVERPASRAALSRAAQRSLNDLRNRYPERPILGKTQMSRVGDVLKKQRAVEYKVATHPAKALLYKGKRISWDSAEGMAMRAQAHNVSPSIMRDFFQQELRSTNLTKYARKSLRRQMASAEAAQKFVTEQGGKVLISDAHPELKSLYEQSKDVALTLDRRMVETGLQPASKLEAAINKPGQIYRRDQAGPPGEMHVSYKRRAPKFSTMREPRLGASDRMGIPRKPSGLTHPLTGKNIEVGAFRNDVPTLTAENAIETHRYIQTIEARNQFIKYAQDTPADIAPGHAVAIRLDSLKNKPLPPEVQDLLDAQRMGRQISGAKGELLGTLYDTFREEIFPPIDPKMSDAYPGVKWIDNRLLGGLNEPSPLASLMQHKWGKRGLAAVDAVNNASKMAILYLKPAYAAPNIFGNTFLTLVQQGFAAPRNLGSALLLERKLGKDVHLVDDLMGEGIVSSGLDSRSGLATGATSWAASKWSKVVDLPFRRAAFLYEARKELGIGQVVGTKNVAGQIHSLLHDPEMRPRLDAVTERANRALIDYADLNPFEQAVIRRIFFFYPWLKGSTKYAGHFLREHPIQAAVTGQLGLIGSGIQRPLGPLPSWGMGLIPVSGGRTLNPTAAGVLNQPAQIAAAIASLSQNNPKSAYQIAGFLTPAVQTLVQASYGAQPGGFQGGQGLSALGSLSDVPLKTLIDQLRGQHGKTFPVTPREALLTYLLGSALVPRKTDVQELHKIHGYEIKPKR